MMRVLTVALASLFLFACSDADTGNPSTPAVDAGGQQADGFPAAGPTDATTTTGGHDDVAALPEDTGIEDVSDESLETTEPPPCEGTCEGKDCGPDGCGATCGSCTGGDICSEAGTCDPDPLAGCGGLDLAENWEGTFDGIYDVAVEEAIDHVA